jgi:hypothetical protein
MSAPEQKLANAIFEKGGLVAALEAQGLDIDQLDRPDVTDATLSFALNLLMAFVPPQPGPFEALRWTVPNPADPDTMPGEGERVVVIYDYNGERNWECCWYDQLLKTWVLCETCGDLEGTALFWAQPKGPNL